MHRLNRRSFALGLLSASALTAGGAVVLRPRDRAVVVGGGPAGVAAALALRAAHPQATVLLVERDPTRLARETEDAAAAAFLRPRAGVTHDRLARAGVQVVLDDVAGIDWSAGRLALFSGRSLAYDRLLLAPGTAPRPEAIEGLDALARHAWPAAWGNPREARRLAAQLAALPDRGHVVLRLPEGVPSHPRAALDRAVLLAGHLAWHRPLARLTVLDGTATDTLSRRFAALPGLAGNTQWVTRAQGATVRAVDAARGLLDTDAGRLRADVVNFVPPQQAGTIAHLSGLVDASGWCPCDGQARSALRPEVLVLGDARKDARRTLSGARDSVLLSLAATPA